MKQIRAFIVDDDADAVSRLEYLLSKNKQVKISGSETDSDQAVYQIRSNKPDLIFLDIEMPGKCGFEILEKIREDGYDPEVIFVTGFDTYAIQAIKESALDYLLKPVDQAELNEALLRFIDSRGVQNLQDEIVDGELTEREEEVFELLREGLTSKSISGKLSISKNTVDTHRRRILKKLGLKSTKEIHLKYPKLK